MSKLGSILRLEYGAALPAENRTGWGYPVFGSNGEVGRHANYLIGEAGIVVGRKGSVGQVIWSDEPYWPIDTAYWVDCRQQDRRWLYWLLSYLPLKRLDTSTGVPGLNRKDVYELDVCRPEPASRDKIAEILDTLDAAIRGTEAVVAKLKAMKQGLLHDLLTRGIDANGDLRPPQPERPHLYKQTPLGWLPNEWETSTVGEIIAEPTRNGLYKPASHHGRGPLMVQMGCLFSDEAVDFSGATRVSVVPIELNQFGLQDGDLLFARRSLVFEGAGLCSIVRDLPEPSTFESSIIRLRLRAFVVLPDFAGLFFRGYASSRQRRTLIRQVAVSGVSSADVKSLYVALPSIDEQREIIQRYVAINEKIDEEGSLLDKLRLQKSGLMDDLLTGRTPVTALL